MIQKTLFGEPCIIAKQTDQSLEPIKNYTGFIVLDELKTIFHITNGIGYYNQNGWSVCSPESVSWTSNNLAEFSIRDYKNLSVVILDEIEGFEYLKFDQSQYRINLQFSESLPHGDMSDPEQVKTVMDFFLAKRIKLYKCLEKEKIVLYPAYPGMLEVLQNKLDIEEIIKTLGE